MPAPKKRNPQDATRRIVNAQVKKLRHTIALQIETIKGLVKLAKQHSARIAKLENR